MCVKMCMRVCVRVCNTSDESYDSAVGPEVVQREGTGGGESKPRPRLSRPILRMRNYINSKIILKFHASTGFRTPAARVTGEYSSAQTTAQLR